MIAKPVNIDILQFLGAADPRPRTGSRIHVTQVIDYMEQASGIKSRRGKWDTGELDLAAQMGFLWERVFETAMCDIAFSKGSYIRVGELELDGIVGTPDLLELEQNRLVELKATWRSSNRFDNMETEFWRWFVQIKSYCYLLETPHALLVPVFINGDWKGSGPQIRATELTFTGQELREAWQMIRQNARHMQDNEIPF